MKKIKWSNILIAICYIAAGIMFFINPNLTKEIICTWLGYGLLIIGAALIASYLLKSKYESFYKDDFSDGLILITIGILALIKKAFFLEFIYFELAIVIVISGYRKLQDCVDAWRFGAKHGALYLVLAAVSIGIGLLILVDSTLSETTLHYLVGGGLLFSGVSDLVSSIFLSSKMIEYVKAVDKPLESDYKQEEPKEETIEAPNIAPQEDIVVEEKPQEIVEEIIDDENKTPEI